MNASAGTLPKIMECAPSPHPLRIAIVYSRLPFPMMRGDQLTVAHLISFLAARGHRIDLYTLDMQGALTAEQRDWLETNCADLRIYRHGKFRMLLGLVRGLLALEPLQVGLFRNSRLARDLRAAKQAGKYDLVYCYYMRSATAVPLDLGLPARAR